MKYLIIICMLFSSCSIFKKTVHQQKQDINKSTLLLKDSSGYLVVEEVKKTDLTQWGVVTTDSGYDKIVDEVIKDYGDSVITIRTTKEKGQKRTDQVSYTSKRDTASSMITEHSQLQEVQTEDSTAITINTNKDIKRSTFLPWWIWLIVTGVVVLGWWKRHSIIEFFT